MSKMLHMNHLDICSTSYGKKKGRESNWQFDSRPLKVGNRPDPGVQMECDTPLESSQGELQVCFRPHPNWRSEQIIMNSQSPGSSNRDSFGIAPWESRDKKPFGCRCLKHGLWIDTMFLPLQWDEFHMKAWSWLKGGPLQGHVQFGVECGLCNMKTKLEQLRESIHWIFKVK